MSSNRVRSRFLRGGIARASKDGTDEEATVAETLLNWWELRSKMVLQWIENNPLLLGISREAVCLIKEQIARGSIAGTPDATRRKIWAHTYVELVSVPGLPTNLLSPLPAPKEAEEKVGAVDVESIKSIVDTHEDPVVKKLWERCGFLQQAVENAEKEIEELSVRCEKEIQAKNDMRVAFEGAEAKVKELTVQVEQLKVTPDKARTTAQGSASSAVKALAPKRPQSARMKPQTSQAAATPTPESTSKESVDLSNMTLLQRNEYWMKRRKEKKEAELLKKKEAEAAEIAKLEEEQRIRRARSSSRWSAVRSRLNSASSSSAAPPPSSSSSSSAGNNGKENSKAQENQAPEKLVKPKKRRRSSVGKKKDKVKHKSGGSDLLAACQKLLSESRKSSSAGVPGHTQETVDLPAMKTEPTDGNETVPSTSQPEPCDKKEAVTKQDTIPPAADPAPASASKAPGSPAFKFFRTTNDNRGQFLVSEDSTIEPGSIFRKRDKLTAQRGVSLVVGTCDTTKREQVISVLFDLDKFPEAKAEGWWHANKHRFPYRRRSSVGQ